MDTILPSEGNKILSPSVSAERQAHFGNGTLNLFSGSVVSGIVTNKSGYRRLADIINQNIFKTVEESPFHQLEEALPEINFKTYFSFHHSTNCNNPTFPKKLKPVATLRFRNQGSSKSQPASLLREPSFCQAKAKLLTITLKAMRASPSH